MNGPGGGGAHHHSLAASVKEAHPRRRLCYAGGWVVGRGALVWVVPVSGSWPSPNGFRPC